MRNLHEFDREAKEFFKQWKVGMMSRDGYLNKMLKLRERAVHGIQEWDCPACLRRMELNPRDMISELKCECGRNYNRMPLLRMSSEARRGIRRSYLAQNAFRQRQNEAYVKRKDNIAISAIRFSSRHKEQKQLDCWM